jgi:general L-amino acid transport system substrate-binding protein
MVPKTIKCAMIAIAFGMAQFATSTAGHAGPVLKNIQQRGVVRCSVSTASGFASHDASGRPVGLMVDFCRAIAAAVFGNAEAVEFRHFARTKEYNAVESHEVDVSFAMNSWAPTGTAGRRIDFGPVVFYDSQNLAAWSTNNSKSIRDRQEAVVCVTAGSSVKQNLEASIRANEQKWTFRTRNTWEETLQAFLSRECSMVAEDRTVLTTAFHDLPQSDSEIAIDGNAISRDALVPVVASGDRQWLLVVRWTMFALILAEEKGITSANALDKRLNGDLETRRLLNGVPNVGVKLGLTDDWAFQVISRLGNYGEVFERNLGKGSPFRVDRQLNKPWTQGGLLYSPPFQ